MATEYRDSIVEPDNNGNGNSGDAGELDPATIGASAEPAEPPKRRRGRPPGGGTGAGSAGTSKRAARKGEKVALDLSAITGMFVGMHALLAERMDTPEIAITPQEGKAFMDAAQNVMRHYSVETTQKTLDFIALAGVAAQIYLPRIAAVQIRKRTPPRPNPGNVVSMSPVMQVMPDGGDYAEF